MVAVQDAACLNDSALRYERVRSLAIVEWLGFRLPKQLGLEVMIGERLSLHPT